MSVNLETPKKTIADFCRRNHIRRLALFGSVLRNDFTSESDVDVLVEFEPGARGRPLGHSAFRFFRIFFANGSLSSLCRGTALPALRSSD